MAAHLHQFCLNHATVNKLCEFCPQNIFFLQPSVVFHSTNWFSSGNPSVSVVRVIPDRMISVIMSFMFVIWLWLGLDLNLTHD